MTQEEICQEQRDKDQSYIDEAEELSECCNACILDEIWLCSDCKEPF